MSELSELIEINKNIVKQNDEIIRLLKVIAGEEDIEEEETGIVEVEEELDLTVDVGEVLFVEDSTIFRLSIDNNETVIDNIKGEGEPSGFEVQEMMANESIKNNKPIADATVILGNEVKGKLPETLKTCVDNKIAKAMLPWDIMKELVYAPYNLQSFIKLDFYKTQEDLINKVFY